MKLTQTLKQRPTVSPQLILANRLLQFSTLELEQVIAQELAENPALELGEVQRCPTCGTSLSSGECPTCDALESPFEDRVSGTDDAFDAGDNALGGYDAGGEWSDPITRLPSRVTLSEHLLRQARLSLPGEDVTIARHVIGSLDDRGFLACDLANLASDLGTEPERVEGVLRVVQSLEPVGIAARDVRECLLIQIAALADDRVELSLAERLIRDQWDNLGDSSLAKLAEAVEASVDEIQDALRFIREGLNPFPAHACWAGARTTSPRGDSRCPQPDVIIREKEAGAGDYQIELPKAGSHRLRVSTSYRRAMEEWRKRPSWHEDNGSPHDQGWKRWEELCGRARLFVKSIEQRWETLYDLMGCLVDYQRDFLIHGEQGLRPLTRARVAEIMGVHESTVSRAVAGKYVQLPSGKLVALDTFFDDTAPIKRAIRELIDQEEEPLSDRVIGERLAETGYNISRRTVAKYRNAMNILPSALRKRSKELCKST